MASIKPLILAILTLSFIPAAFPLKALIGNWAVLVGFIPAFLLGAYVTYLDNRNENTEGD